MPNWIHPELKSTLNLVQKMTRRDIAVRYRGSALGLLWSLLLPLMMLGIYTFVFSVVFEARWGQGEGGSRTDFALSLFIGLMLFNVFAECFNKAPYLISGNVNYVKKVVFPLQILPVISFCSALFHLALSFGVWLLFYLGTGHSLPLTAGYFLLLLLPSTLLLLGILWILSSLSVFIRDIAQLTSVITSALLFLTPIFYPLMAIPEDIRPYLQLNPLAFLIEQSRAVLMQGLSPDWSALLAYSALSVLVGGLGYWWFMKTKKGFADVL